MSISVMVPTLLRTFTHDQKRIEVQGNTVLDVIEQMERDYPGVKLLREENPVAVIFARMGIQPSYLKVLQECFYKSVSILQIFQG